MFEILKKIGIPATLTAPVVVKPTLSVPVAIEQKNKLEEISRTVKLQQDRLNMLDSKNEAT